MKQKIITKFILITSLLGFAAIARAQDASPAPTATGLLGQTYAGLNYTYIDLDNSPTNADSFGFEYNQAINAGLDGVLTYDWTQSGAVAGNRVK